MPQVDKHGTEDNPHKFIDSVLDHKHPARDYLAVNCVQAPVCPSRPIQLVEVSACLNWLETVQSFCVYLVGPAEPA